MTPLEFAAADGCTTVLFIGIFAGIVWVIVRWLPRKWREASAVIDDATTVVCDPCHGRPGRCTCTVKCRHPQCGAGDTAVSDREFSRELRQLLDAEGEK
jgi:hypothetical protein